MQDVGRDAPMQEPADASPAVCTDHHQAWLTLFGDAADLGCRRPVGRHGLAGQAGAQRPFLHLCEDLADALVLGGVDVRDDLGIPVVAGVGRNGGVDD
jgi:hypothetical protein